MRIMNGNNLTSLKSPELGYLRLLKVELHICPATVLISGAIPPLPFLWLQVIIFT